MQFSTTSIKIGQLLIDGRSYYVPVFQRSFAWEKEQVSEFWDDLMDIHLNRKGEGNYFLGSMVFTVNDNDSYVKILDGQQRFGTFLLFLSALRDELKRSNLPNTSKWT
ncbi:MAG: DUF262 domain-containing protein, partial [Candidatus Heimdallarchaeaceae archaeon]